MRCLSTWLTWTYKKGLQLQTIWMGMQQKRLNSLFLLEEAPAAMTTGLEDWKLETTNGQNLLFYKGKNYIPKDIGLRRDIVKTFHDHEKAGHPGEIGTYNAVRQHYWWPGLRTFIKNYVQGCGTCQQFKIDRSPAKPAY